MNTPTPAMKLRPGASLLLASICEPSNNDLQVVVVEALATANQVETDLGLASPVRALPTSRAFEVTWWRYVAYAVRNESYFRAEPEEQRDQGPFGTRTDTALLRYVADTTFATDDYPGQLKQWFLYAEWQCVDVVSDTAPEVRELTAAEVETLIKSLDEKGR